METAPPLGLTHAQPLTNAIELEVAHFSLEGGREENEDRLAVSDRFPTTRFFVLADGAGGQGGGAIAAQTGVSAASEEFAQLPAFSLDCLLRCLKRAHEAVHHRQLESSSLARMAATFVGLLIDCRAGAALFANLGDSRCYVFRGEQILAQSRDHSLVQRFIDAGVYPAERLRFHPKRNVLYASLGANEDQTLPHFSEAQISLQVGDALLLCSDGVWEALDEATLAHLNAHSASAQTWSDALIAAVRGRMAPRHDNFSAIVIRCISPATTV